MNEPQDDVPPTDAERFAIATRELVGAVRSALERRINLADHRQRRNLEAAFQRYCELIVELHESETK